jgi:ketosteroid isomerase-like protein
VSAGGTQATNVEMVRGLVQAVIDGDQEAFTAHLTPDVEWDDREGWPGVRRVYHGREETREWLERFMAAGGEIVQAEIEEISEASENRILAGVFGTFRSRVTGTPTEFNARAWYVFWLRDGEVSRAQLFWVRSEALRAAGLSG